MYFMYSCRCGPTFAEVISLLSRSQILNMRHIFQISEHGNFFHLFLLSKSFFFFNLFCVLKENYIKVFQVDLDYNTYFQLSTSAASTT